MSNTMGTPHPYDVDFTTGPREFLGDKGLNKGNVGAPNVKPAARAEELLQAGISSKGASNVPIQLFQQRYSLPRLPDYPMALHRLAASQMIILF